MNLLQAVEDGRKREELNTKFTKNTKMHKALITLFRNSISWVGLSSRIWINGIALFFCLYASMPVIASSFYYIKDGDILSYTGNSGTHPEIKIPLPTISDANTFELVLLDFKETGISNEARAEERPASPVFLYMKSRKTLSADEYYDYDGEEVFFVGSTRIPRQLSPNCYPDASFSPDGQLIAFVVHPSDLIIETIEGKQIARIPMAAAPSWSLRGDFIAFVQLTSYEMTEIPDKHRHGISIYEIESNKSRALTTGHFDYSPIVTPNGSEILFLSLARGERFWKVDRKESEPKALIVSDRSVADWGSAETISWSSNGLSLFFDFPLRITDDDPQKPIYSVLSLDFDDTLGIVSQREIIQGAKSPYIFADTNQLGVLRIGDNEAKPLFIPVEK